MPLPESLSRLLEEHELEVKRSRGRVAGKHRSLPIVLDIFEIGEKKAVIALQPLDELRESIEELLENDEDVDTLIEDVLAEMRDIALEAQRLLEKHGYRVSLELLEGENDVRETLEEIKEMYELYAEEGEEYFVEE